MNAALGNDEVNVSEGCLELLRGTEEGKPLDSPVRLSRHVMVCDQAAEVVALLARPDHASSDLIQTTAQVIRIVRSVPSEVLRPQVAHRAPCYRRSDLVAMPRSPVGSCRDQRTRDGPRDEKHPRDLLRARQSPTGPATASRAGCRSPPAADAARAGRAAREAIAGLRGRYYCRTA